MSESHSSASRVATFTPQGALRPDSPGQVYGITYAENGEIVGRGFARSDELASWHEDLTAGGWTVKGIYEFGVRYTDDTGQSGIAYDPDKFDPHDRAFADMRTRGMRTAQEDRDIPKDATLMRRLPAGSGRKTLAGRPSSEPGTSSAPASKPRPPRRNGGRPALSWTPGWSSPRRRARPARSRSKCATTPPRPLWGVGLTNPVVRSIVISAYCVVCGTPRGMPRQIHQCEDGVHYWPHVWDNPCGHVDMYAAVVKEAKEFAATRAGDVR
ncbi:hypothetical protein [Nonomuraea basaltis]|uniref:hypothetical protein n=1 Tax=Nonomuraea basaltis TaxID=2495887 RepID=UPI00110C63D4|nr:hypothetical protein [Nonomuraea basaltis]TMR97884.1 hypothetical protein EJK15_15370 [Nonomuraea basaltis]